MDLSAEFEKMIKEMEWYEVIDNVKAIVDDIVGEPSPVPPPSPPPAPVLPAEMWSSTQPLPVDRDIVEYNPEEAAPHSSGLNVHAAPFIPRETLSQPPVMEPAQVYGQRQVRHQV